MQVQIDQSGRIDTSGATALGMANGLSRGLYISGGEKAKLLKGVRERRKKWRKTEAEVYTFATLIFLLIKEQIDQLETIVIDIEFPGWDARIENHIKNLLRNEGISVRGKRFSFEEIHKRKKEPNAHKLAWRVLRRKAKADITLKAKDVLKYF